MDGHGNERGALACHAAAIALALRADCPMAPAPLPDWAEALGCPEAKAFRSGAFTYLAVPSALETADPAAIAETLLGFAGLSDGCRDLRRSILAVHVPPGAADPATAYDALASALEAVLDEAALPDVVYLLAATSDDSWWVWALREWPDGAVDWLDAGPLEIPIGPIADSA